MDKQLQNYIQKEKKLGINNEQIKQELIKADWQEKDINEAFDVLSKNIELDKQQTKKSGSFLKESRKDIFWFLAVIFLVMIGVGIFVFTLDIQENNTGEPFVLVVLISLEFIAVIITVFFLLIFFSIRSLIRNRKKEHKYYPLGFYALSLIFLEFTFWFLNDSLGIFDNLGTNLGIFKDSFESFEFTNNLNTLVSYLCLAVILYLLYLMRKRKVSVVNKILLIISVLIQIAYTVPTIFNFVIKSILTIFKSG